MYKRLEIIIALAIAMLLPTNAFAEHKDYSQNDITQTIDGILRLKKAETGADSDTLLSDKFIADAGSQSADWYAFSVGRMSIGEDCSAYGSKLCDYVCEKYQTPQKLDRKKATEWHRISLTLLSLGVDPTAVGDDKIDLIADGTYNRGSDYPLDAQGLNGLAWGLIVLDSKDFQLPENAQLTQVEIVNKILSKQNSDGSFSLVPNTGDVDMTAMVLTALAPHTDDIKVADSTKKAIEYLSSVQENDGGFSVGSEAISQSIIALCSLGSDPLTDEKFIKNGNTLMDALMSYQRPDGGFAHLMSDNMSNPISCQQSLLAMICLYRFQNGMSALFDLSDVNVSSQTNSTSTNDFGIIFTVTVAFALLLTVIIFITRKRRVDKEKNHAKQNG